MKVAAPTLLPLLRSPTQGHITAYLFLRPDRDHTATQIAADLGVSLPTVTREVARLIDAGLVCGTKRGNTRYLRVQTTNPVFGPLADLMAVTFGPVPVLRDLLAEVVGVEEAFIYGSWAARAVGRSGPVPGDVDLLVLGTPDRDLLDEALDGAERVLRREVNLRLVAPLVWAADRGGFRTTVLGRPLVQICPCVGVASATGSVREVS